MSMSKNLKGRERVYKEGKKLNGRICFVSKFKWINEIENFFWNPASQMHLAVGEAYFFFQKNKTIFEIFIKKNLKFIEEMYVNAYGNKLILFKKLL